MENQIPGCDVGFCQSLGYQLLNAGVIDEAQHRESVALMQKSSIRHGEALVGLEMIEQEALDEQLRQQVRARLLNCFCWTEAEYGLVYDPNVSDSVESFQLNPLVLVFDGIKTSFPVAPLVNHFDQYNRRPVRKTARLSDYSTMLKEFSDELRVALLCDGQHTVGEVISASPFGLVDTLRVLRALQVISCVEFDEARPAAKLESTQTPRPRRRRTSEARSRAPNNSSVAPTNAPPPTHSEPAPPRRPQPATSRRPAAASQPASGATQPAAAANHIATDHGMLQQITGRHAMLGTANHYEMLQVAVNATLQQIGENYNRLLSLNWRIL